MPVGQFRNPCDVYFSAMCVFFIVIVIAECSWWPPLSIGVYVYNMWGLAWFWDDLKGLDWKGWSYAMGLSPHPPYHILRKCPYLHYIFYWMASLSLCCFCFVRHKLRANVARTFWNLVVHYQNFGYKYTVINGTTRISS